MSETTNDVLSRAYELIEANQLEEARRLLEPLTVSSPNNADMWWLYTHAVTTVDEAEKSLTQLMRIDPTYPGAAELKGQLEQQRAERRAQAAPTGGGIRRLGRVEAVSDADIDDILSGLEEKPTAKHDFETDYDTLFGQEATPAATADDDFDFDDFAMESPSKAEKPQRQGMARRITPIFLLLVVVILLLVAALLLLGRGGDDDNEDVVVDTAGTSAAIASTTQVSAVSTSDGISDEDFQLTATAILLEAGAQSATSETSPEEPTEAPTLTATTEEVVSAVTETPTEAQIAENTPTENVVETATSEPPTEAPTEIVVEQPTLQPTVDAATPIVIQEQTINDILAERFTLTVDNPINIQTTALGNTFVASVCTTPGSGLRSTLNNVMRTLAQENARITEPIDAVGVRLLSCDTSTVLNFIAVPLADAVAFSNGEISETVYRGRWRAV